jgi:hypothetical protein
MVLYMLRYVYLLLRCVYVLARCFQLQAAIALTHPFVIRQNVFAAMEMQLVSIKRYKPLQTHVP